MYSLVTVLHGERGEGSESGERKRKMAFTVIQFAMRMDQHMAYWDMRYTIPSLAALLKVLFITLALVLSP